MPTEHGITPASFSLCLNAGDDFKHGLRDAEAFLFSISLYRGRCQLHRPRQTFSPIEILRQAYFDTRRDSARRHFTPYSRGRHAKCRAATRVAITLGPASWSYRRSFTLPMPFCLMITNIYAAPAMAAELLFISWARHCQQRVKR